MGRKRYKNLLEHERQRWLSVGKFILNCGKTLLNNKAIYIYIYIIYIYILYILILRASQSFLPHLQDIYGGLGMPLENSKKSKT